MPKQLIIPIIILILAGAGIGIYYWQKSPKPLVSVNTNVTVNANTNQQVATGPKKDDWQYKPPSEGEDFITKSANFLGMGGGAPTGAAPMMAEKSIGLSVGGAKDVNNFRENIKNKYLPLPTDLTYEGLYYDYYFDTGKQEECKKLFCPSYSKAVSADPVSKNSEYFMTVGLNSGIKESDFKRKKLNLVIVMDISGSMGSPFDEYYYDQFGNKVESKDNSVKNESKTKMQIADESVVSMLKHLNPDDRFGMVLFDDSAYLAKPLSIVGETDMEAIKKHILEITEQGSTNMEDGIKKGSELFKELKNVDQNEYENRIIFLTDAEPNTGDTSKEGFMGLTKKNAEDKINMTFIGIGVDFNTELIEAITKVRGANYYSVHSSKEFTTRMDDEFDFMVTPLVFNLELNLKAKGFEIQKVYGSPEASLATGEIMKVNTLFPSKTSEAGTKGGVVLLQLKKLSDDASITLKTSYEDRSGKNDGDEVTVNFGTDKTEYYDNNGIRKAILLARYGNLIKDWIIDQRQHSTDNNRWVPVITEKDGIIIPILIGLSEWERQSMPLNVSDDYKKLFKDFAGYFEQEMNQLNDKDLGKELEILKKLGGV